MIFGGASIWYQPRNEDYPPNRLAIAGGLALAKNDFLKMREYLDLLEFTDPAEAVRQARAMVIDGPQAPNFKVLKAAVLVNAGVTTKQKDAIEEGLALHREIFSEYKNPSVRYSLATAIISFVDASAGDADWVDHNESTKVLRAEARGHFWHVAQDKDADDDVRTQSWTNLSNQLTGSWRLSESHDARLAALKIDPKNGVAAASAIRYLMSCYHRGLCSDLAIVEASALAKIARENRDRIVEYAGLLAADDIADIAARFPDPPRRAVHKNLFVCWVEQERLTLSPSVELVDPDIEELDWLVLPGVRDRSPVQSPTPPPIFGMFNQLKSDYILARDLAWRSTDDRSWPITARFADTLDYALYGPASSALVLAHRASLDLLDKIAVTANHHFKLGLNYRNISFGKAWRIEGARLQSRDLTPEVDAVIRKGVRALYGLVELADDYDAHVGRLRPLKELRNTSTHRFLVLHDPGDPKSARQADEIVRYPYDDFRSETLAALRVARAAIQMLAEAIAQYEALVTRDDDEVIISFDVQDHDWVRGKR